MSARPMSAFGSKRVIATLTRSGPHRCRRWLTIRVGAAQRRQLLVRDDDDLRRRVDGFEHGRLGAWAIKHDERYIDDARSSSRRMRVDLERRSTAGDDRMRAGRHRTASRQSGRADRSRRGDRCSRAHRRRRTGVRRRGTRRRRRRRDANRSAASVLSTTSVIEVARLTATVVLPTPPLAPTIANVLPTTRGADGRATRRIAATRSS